MTFSLEREKNDLETLIYLYLYYKNIDINNISIYKNMIINNFNDILSLEKEQILILSKNINYIIRNYLKEWNKIVLMLGLKLLENNENNFLNNLEYVNNKYNEHDIYLPFKYVEINEIFNANIDNMLLPLVWIYHNEYKCVTLYVAYGEMYLFNNFNIKYISKIKKYPKIIKYNYSWIGFQN
jgi:hypothetical protein